MKRFALQLALICAAGSLTLSAASIQATLPEFNGSLINSGFPLPAVTVGTFTYTIPVGEQIVSASFSSTFGNSVFPNSAGIDVFVGGILVGTCVQLDTCDTANVVTPFSHVFLPADFATLGSGSLAVTVVQNGANVIRLGQETLNLTTAASSATPEPASVALFGLGMAALGLVKARRRTTR